MKLGNVEIPDPANCSKKPSAEVLVKAKVWMLAKQMAKISGESDIEVSPKAMYEALIKEMGQGDLMRLIAETP